MAAHTDKLINAGTIEIEDFAPLIYLKYLIHGIDEKIPVKQIIIDEAQDFSVFQLYALRKIIKDSSFTILGDLSQGIHSYRGIKDWKDVISGVFDDRKTGYLTLEQSYRTTVEIMDAANEVISMLEGEFIKAKPVIRHGEPVRPVKSMNYKEMVSDISQKITETLAKGFKSIAVICKTLEECKLIQTEIKRTVPEIYLITGKEDQYKGGIVAAPSYLSKGLEFDAVFIANAADFSSEEFDLKLLYVAMTRALHKLQLYYTGETSPVLERIQKLVSG